jgi:GNAT superfamily N-acetyltransferase
VTRTAELSPPETGLAFGAMRALRTALVDVDAFVRHVNETQRPEGYRLVGAFEEGRPEALAVAGFRALHNLAWGHAVYVDDLSTLPEARRRGYAGLLLEWVLAEARRLGCDEVHLDSGVGDHRADAHRLYLNFGMRITSHHFGRSIM